MLRLLMHALAAGQFWYSVYYDWNYVNVSSVSTAPKWGGKFKYLTFINAILQSLFFTICVVNDVIGSNEVSPKKVPLIRKIKDFLHVTIGFPLATFVATTFWGLYAVDRELVFPKALDPYFPTWLNHIMHTNVLIFSLIEMLISFRQYPKRKPGYLTHTVFMLAYLVWTLIIFFKTGGWVYPVMEVLNWPLRVVFMAALLVYSLFLYYAGEKLNEIVWSKELKVVTSSKKKLKSKAN